MGKAMGGDRRGGQTSFGSGATAVDGLAGQAYAGVQRGDLYVRTDVPSVRNNSGATRPGPLRGGKTSDVKPTWPIEHQRSPAAQPRAW